ncbi:MAG: hypothetical protein E6H77_03840 [Betaproteobacteria bacterium]|nr:MAG: hypothetical protein E6H77_03840 [Betaproteobacteria bacterium]
MRRDERPLASLPIWLWLALAAALAAQIGFRALHSATKLHEADLPPPPSASALRLAGLGERAATARLAMLYLQAFQSRKLDYQRLVEWLHNILELDPRSQYPLFLAARVYAETPDETRARLMLDFIYGEFLVDPDRRWPWLAAALDRHTQAADLPLWARQMELFILEDMNELEAARIMLGGLLASGAIQDPAEARFLAGRLKSLEERMRRERR